jgi:hypothetical protein
MAEGSEKQLWAPQLLLNNIYFGDRAGSSHGGEQTFAGSEIFPPRKGCALRSDMYRPSLGRCRKDPFRADVVSTLLLQAAPGLLALNVTIGEPCPQCDQTYDRSLGTALSPASLEANHHPRRSAQLLVAGPESTARPYLRKKTAKIRGSRVFYSCKWLRRQSGGPTETR